MTKYTKLKNMKDNFILAAANAKSTFMIALWIHRAESIQHRIDKMTLNEAMGDC